MPPTFAPKRGLLPLSMLALIAASARAEPPTGAAVTTPPPVAAANPADPAPVPQTSREAPAAGPAPGIQHPDAAPSAVGPAGPAEPLVVDRSPGAAPTEAWIHVAVDYGGAWLEARSRIDQDPWHRLCATPCDRAVVVDGLEVRVTAPRMTPSNTFLIEPGSGAARLRVAGGSAFARSLGIIGLAGGLPVTFGGITLLGLGSIQSEPGERTAGIVTLAVGAAAVLVALPLLVAGSTTVKNAEGHYVAKRAAVAF